MFLFRRNHISKCVKTRQKSPKSPNECQIFKKIQICKNFQICKIFQIISICPFLHNLLCVFPAYEDHVSLEIKEYTDDTFTTVIDDSNQDLRKTLAGQTIYLSMRGSVPDGFKYAVSDCSIVTPSGSRFLLIEPGTPGGSCGLDGVGMRAFYDSGNFNLQHILFLLEDAASASSFSLECSVDICDETDPNSVCNKAVLPCMEEAQKTEYFCDGFCDEKCEVTNDVPVCTGGFWKSVAKVFES